jgi:hypothetical protein
VCDHDRCSLLAFPTGKPTKFGAEIRPFRVARSVGTFDEDRPEPLVAFAGPPTLALPGTLIVPWADLGPGAEMLGGGKPRHLDANFCDEILSRTLTDTRDCIQERDDLRERATQHLNLGFTLRNTLFKELNMGQDVREQLGMVGPEAPLQSGVEVLPLLPQAPLREFRSFLGAHHARQQGPQDGAPRHAHDIGGHTGQLDIRLFQHLLEAIHFRTMGINQLTTVAREIAEVANLDGRDEAAPE